MADNPEQKGAKGETERIDPILDHLQEQAKRRTTLTTLPIQPLTRSEVFGPFEAAGRQERSNIPSSA